MTHKEEDVKKILEENNCKLLSPYVNTKIKIEILCGKCRRNTYSVRFKFTNFNQFMCNRCSKEESMKKRDLEVYNYDNLNEYSKNKNFEICKDYSHINVNRDTQIEFSCKNCGQVETKSFRELKNYGPYCSSHIKDKRYEKQRKTNKKRYGSEHLGKINQDKARKTKLDKYGKPYATQCQDVINKTKKTNNERYGCDNVFQNEEINNKIIKERKEKYGVEYHFQNPEYLKSIMEKTINNHASSDEILNGYKYPTQLKKIKEKTKKTNNKRYGCDNPMQNKEVYEKSQKNMAKIKEYKMPSGDIRKVRGYEPNAIKYLLNCNYDENDILTSAVDIPSFKYIFDGKSHTYYPDIYIKSSNIIIEVKSPYTYRVDFSKNMCKKKSVQNTEYNFQLWIFTSNNSTNPIIIKDYIFQMQDSDLDNKLT